MLELYMMVNKNTASSCRNEKLELGASHDVTCVFFFFPRELFVSRIQQFY